MPHTTISPPNDSKMWRRLIACTHPDAGGEGELFSWNVALTEKVCGGELRIEPKTEPTEQPSRRREAAPDDKARVPYPTWPYSFEETTCTALQRGAVGMPYGRVLSLLADCKPLEPIAYEQERGASYKRLAAGAHAWGMSKQVRGGWYRVAEDLPLSDRHAGHILARLKKRAA